MKKLLGNIVALDQGFVHRPLDRGCVHTLGYDPYDQTVCVGVFAVRVFGRRVDPVAKG